MKVRSVAEAAAHVATICDFQNEENLMVSFVNSIFCSASQRVWSQDIHIGYSVKFLGKVIIFIDDKTDP